MNSPKFNSLTLSFLNHQLESSWKDHESCFEKYAYRLVKQGQKTIAERAPVFCNQWCCTFCGPKKAEQLSELLIIESRKHGLDWVIYLEPDVRSTIYDAPDSFSQVMKAWKAMREAMYRRFGRDLKFIYVLKKNWRRKMGVEVLVNQTIDEKSLSEIALQSGGCDVRYVERTRDIVFTCDYLARGLLEPGFPKAARRFDGSPNIKLRLEKLEAPWEVVPGLDDLNNLPIMFGKIHKKYDQDGKLIYLVVREPHYHEWKYI